MHHVQAWPELEALVQVGLRDVAPDELQLIEENPKIHAHFDWDLKRQRARGKTWQEACAAILTPLGQEVYLSVDVDGLDPRYCPHTGTPVPGGLELWELFHLFEELVASGRRIVGADLVEVAPGEDEWDANVGARILYQLCQFMAASGASSSLR
jgi:agmatinase